MVIPITFANVSETKAEQRFICTHRKKLFIHPKIIKIDQVDEVSIITGTFYAYTYIG